MPRRMGALPPASTIGRPDNLLLWVKRMFCPSEKERAEKEPHALAPRRPGPRARLQKTHPKITLRLSDCSTGKRIGMVLRDRRNLLRKENAASGAGAVRSCVMRWLNRPPRKPHLKSTRGSRPGFRREDGANQSRMASAHPMRRSISARTIAACWWPCRPDPDIFAWWTLSRGSYDSEKG